MKSKLVFGVGIYEEGEYKSYENGKLTKAYNAWNGILRRCYNPKYQSKRPTYIDCSICSEWLDFQVFAKWFEESYPNDGEQYQLDKDLKLIGNRVYSPEACLFVPQIVNSFTTDCGRARGEYMIGVDWHKQGKKFRSLCGNPLTKKREHLGLFADELSAHLAWRKRKSELVYQLAMEQSNPEVRDALLRWKDALDSNKIHTV